MDVASWAGMFSVINMREDRIGACSSHDLFGSPQGKEPWDTFHMGRVEFLPVN
jgi:hypothetical protein